MRRRSIKNAKFVEGGLSFRRPLFVSSMKPEVNSDFFWLTNVVKLGHIHNMGGGCMGSYRSDVILTPNHNVSLT